MEEHADIRGLHAVIGKVDQRVSDVLIGGEEVGQLATSVLGVYRSWVPLRVFVHSGCLAVIPYIFCIITEY